MLFFFLFFDLIFIAIWTKIVTHSLKPQRKIKQMTKPQEPEIEEWSNIDEESDKQHR